MFRQRTRRQAVGHPRALARVAGAGVAAFAIFASVVGFAAPPAKALTPTPTTTAYVVDMSGKVALIDTASRTVTDWITVPDATMMALDPSGAHAYVTTTGTGGVGGVRVIDTATQAVSAPIPVGLYPRGIAVDPSGSYVYVSNRDDSTVSVIDTSTDTVTATIPDVGSGPQNVVFDPTGAHAYVATHSGVAVIDTSTEAVTALIPVAAAFDVVIDPSGSRLYVSSPGSSTPLSVIDTATEAVIATVAVPGAGGLALTPYADKLYVTVAFSPGGVAVVDTATNTVIKTLQDTALQSSVFPAITADGASVYVPEVSASNVAVIDTSTNTVSGTITDSGFFAPYQVVMNGHPQLVAPAAPTALKAKVTKAGSVTLTWTDHGTGITDHKVQAFVYTKATKKNGGPTYDPVTPQPLLTGSAAASYTYENLSAGLTYVFKVAAVNVAGSGDFSNYSNTVTIKP